MRSVVGGLLFLSVLSGSAIAQTYPSPTFNNMTLNGQLNLTGSASKFKQYYNATVTMVANPSCASAQLWFCSQAFLSGTITGGTAMARFYFQDVVSSTTNSAGLEVLHNVAPSGNSASGPRVALDVLLTQVGSLQGGTITNPGISSAGRTTIFMQSNLSGTSTAYAGAGNAFNTSCQIYATATYVIGCSGLEIDIGAYSTATYDQKKGLMIVQTSNNKSLGRLGGDIGLFLANQVGFTYGLSNGFQIGSQESAWPLDMNGFGKIFYAQKSNNPAAYPTVAGTGFDISVVKLKGPVVKGPFWSEIPFQATGITGSTRLTSDGAAATGYIQDATVTNSGSGYTSFPTVSITGCTGAVINASLSNGVIGVFGVNTPGTGCAAEATMSVSGGGGASGAGTLTIAGNTFNFPIKSTVNFYCTVAADTFATGGTDAVGWHIFFGATMGNTASTTAIVGSPAWVLDYQTTGAAAKFSGSAPSAPAADTTLGGVNLTAVPTTGTWNIGGMCRMVRSAQI